MSIIFSLCIIASLFFVYQWFSRISLDNPMFKGGLLYGMITAFIVQSLAQDAIGQAAYISYVSISWVSAYITVPLAIISLIILSISLYVRFRLAVNVGGKDENK